MMILCTVRLYLSAISYDFVCGINIFFYVYGITLRNMVFQLKLNFLLKTCILKYYSYFWNTKIMYNYNYEHPETRRAKEIKKL